ncbi:hypothetical protein [Stieleria varia]|uniref:hypothetical protein n=1 Tax=Stieleria varia TaxID=2528005 RepID=UPI0018D2071F|nr:hypothetical protein [Stieleria varia]
MLWDAGSTRKLSIGEDLQVDRASFDDFATPEELGEKLPAWLWFRLIVSRHGCEDVARSLEELWDVGVCPAVRAVHHVSRGILGFDLGGSFTLGGKRHDESNK